MRGPVRLLLELRVQAVRGCPVRVTCSIRIAASRARLASGRWAGRGTLGVVRFEHEILTRIG